MKIKYITFSLFLSVMLIQCAVEKKTTYDIPHELPPAMKDELIVNLEKGRILFKTYCSDCHGIFTKGKDGVPNFTEKEIVNYMTAYQASDEKNHAVIKQLLPEELSMILTFLRLRKFKGKTDH